MHKYRFYLSILSLALLFANACNKPGDDTITTEIKAKMFSEPSLKSASVNVASKNGVVTLTGVVPDDTARLAAERIASQTNGVKQIIDSTTMATPAPVVAETLPPPSPKTAPTPPKSSARRKQAAREPESAPSPAAAPTAEATSAAAPEPLTPPPAPAAPAPPPPPPPPQPVTVTIPESSIVTIRTIDSIDSTSSSTGQFFRGSLDAPIVVGDQVVLPKGLNVKLKLVEASSAGKFKGRSELTVSLESITYQGKTYALMSTDVQQKGGSRGKRSAAVIGGGAALGALIGGLAGGGKGAAIGAGVGAGGGTAVQAMTKGEKVRIPAETRLDFTLHAPVAVTYIPPKKVSRVPPADADQTPPADQPTHP
ncbi:MAG: BON domain-containing protein [Candidatus Acidiferrum sp.]